MSYLIQFNKALKFTESRNFTIDSNNLNEPTQEQITSLISNLSKIINQKMIQELFEKSNNNHDEISNLGSSCGTVHAAVLQEIKNNHRNLNANITIGDVALNNEIYFKFDQERCCRWLDGEIPPILDCHVWITIGKDFILDCTIGTYINTRLAKDKIYGGIIYGNPSSLNYQKFIYLNNKEPSNLNELIYNPTILGVDALVKLAPEINHYPA